MNLREIAGRLQRKHLIILLIAGGAVFVILLWIREPEQQLKPVKQSKPVNVNLLGDTDVEKEHWRATAEKELEELKNRQQEVSNQLSTLMDQLKKPGEKARPSIQLPKDFPPMPPFPSLTLPIPPPKPTEPPPPPPNPIRTFSPETASFTTVPEMEKGSRKRTAAEGEEPPYLPSGSFVRGMLLSGLDAPAGVTASKEPHPVLIKLSDLAVLPNRFRLDIRDCFILGEGYGDLSSERAYIRTTSFSCVRHDGSSLDIPMKGFVAGEDGKVGLRGRVVSKQGQFLARAAIAGFAEGMSDVLKLSNSTVSVSPLGSTQTVDPQKALQAGAMGGAGKALERLAQHYIDMADRLFPVIEIDAGRTVEVVVLQGRPLEAEREGKGK